MSEWEGTMKNYYGSLCTEMYELLHAAAPEDELAFYLSCAKRGDRILEPLCGSGRFLVPFLERGFDIQGIDLSGEMLEKLRQKAPGARVVQTDLIAYEPEGQFDYIFISSGSISLFTDQTACRSILSKMRTMLKKGGKFVFAAETMADRCADSGEAQVTASVQTAAGETLVLKTRYFYDAETQTQFSPGVYGLYRDGELLQSEEMDFQTHLYRLGEMEEMLAEAGFSEIKVYESYGKKPAASDHAEMFLFECTC